MNTKYLADAAAELFDDLEKWHAFFEIHELSDHIIETWLCRGAEAIRAYFEREVLPGIECEPWGGLRDTRWYFTEDGPDSFGIGIGWPSIELHLFAPASAGIDVVGMAARLKEPEFLVLASHFDGARGIWSGEGIVSLTQNAHFNPVGSRDQIGSARIREMAWIAGNRTAEYGEKMGAFVKSILTGRSGELIRRLNEQVPLRRR